ncbi:MAG: flavin reductase family protein, partial [Pseudomonadota bacterium]|nr:flavin reductase family protein [Pseudomonadota bacterium]
MKTFDLAVLSAADSYKLLRNVVTPRPIALVTTIDAAGVVNAAPFSFFNA